jgi:hypothetical protein
VIVTGASLRLRCDLSTQDIHAHDEEAGSPKRYSDSDSRQVETMRRKGLAAIHDACRLMDRDQVAHLRDVRALYSVAWLCLWETEALDLEPRLQEVWISSCVCVCV